MDESKTKEYEKLLPKNPWWFTVLYWILFPAGWLLVKVLVFFAERKDRDGDTWLLDWW